MMSFVVVVGGDDRFCGGCGCGDRIVGEVVMGFVGDVAVVMGFVAGCGSCCDRFCSRL